MYIIWDDNIKVKLVGFKEVSLNYTVVHALKLKKFDILLLMMLLCWFFLEIMFIIV